MTEILRNETAENNVFLPPEKLIPTIHRSATIRNSQVTGNVTIGKNVHIVNAVIRADEGTPFYIGKGSNVQDFCTLHGYVTRDHDREIEDNLIPVEDKFYSIYIDEYVTVAHGALIHGPAYIGTNTFIGFKATIDASIIGNNVEIGAHSYIKRVTIPDNIAIAPNAVIINEDDIEKYMVEPIGINQKIVKVNLEMAEAYNMNEKIYS